MDFDEAFFFDLPKLNLNFSSSPAEELVLQPVDAIITSPPYPGVYNYMAAVEEAAKDLGLRWEMDIWMDMDGYGMMMFSSYNHH